MRITIDPLNSSLLPRLAAPEARVRDEEEFLLIERVQSGKHLVWRGIVVLLPCLVCSLQATGVGNVLTQCKFAVDVEGLIVRAGNGEVGVLVDETSCSFFKGCNGRVVPPIRVVSDLVVASSSGIEGWTQLG